MESRLYLLIQSPAFFHVLVVLVLVIVASTASCILYNLYFHPLASFPGPISHRATNIPFLHYTARGTTVQQWSILHARYGPVVRISPNELSYIRTAAWKEIYGLRGQDQEMIKEELIFPGDDFEFFAAKPMISCDAVNHARHRRAVGPAFSDRAVREYETYIREYGGDMMKKLEEKSRNGGVLNMVEWFNFVMFDITSQLVFGESFGCLAREKYHPWVARVFPGMKLIAGSMVIAGIPGLGSVVQWLVPKIIPKEAGNHIQEVKDMTNKRLAMSPERVDFMTHILSARTAEKDLSLSLEELYLDAQLLTIAGSETTATLLSGAVFLLSRNPQVARTLAKTLRSAFPSEEHLTPASVAKIPYLVAVISECLRLYPPGAINMPRTVPPGGAVIDGTFVPAGSVVGIAQYAAYRSPLHFADPLRFAPERWLGDDPAYAGDNRDVFHPFSYGPRNCVGRNLALLEVRYLLARLVWNFDVEVLEGQQDWMNHGTFLSWAKPPLWVRLQAADHASTSAYEG